MLQDITIPDQDDYINELVQQVENIISGNGLSIQEKGKLLIEIKSEVEHEIFIVEKFDTRNSRSQLVKHFGSHESEELIDVIGLTKEYETLTELRKKIELFIFGLYFTTGSTGEEDNIEKEKKTVYTVAQLNILVKVLFELSIVPDISNKTEISTPLHMIFGRSKNSIRQELSTELKKATNDDLRKVISDFQEMIDMLKKHL